jgi:hypothetical protein
MVRIKQETCNEYDKARQNDRSGTIEDKCRQEKRPMGQGGINSQSGGIAEQPEVRTAKEQESLGQFQEPGPVASEKLHYVD